MLSILRISAVVVAAVTLVFAAPMDEAAVVPVDGGAVTPNSISPRGIGCGLATFSNLVGVPMVGDFHCRRFKVNGDLRQYNILSGCSCFYFFYPNCGGKAVGIKGPQEGWTETNGVMAYKCMRTGGSASGEAEALLAESDTI